jgi:hypothetical protein
MSEPYVSAEVQGAHVVLVNSSADRAVGGIAWRFEGDEPSRLAERVAPPAGGLVLPPAGTQRIAMWAPVFGAKPVKVVARWVGEDGAVAQHTSTLSP